MRPNIIARFSRDDSGATAIEYGLIAALVAVAMISATTRMGTSLSDAFQKVADNISK